MTKPLTDQDIKNLKYQCRMGYIIPFLLFIISITILVVTALTKDIGFVSLNFIMSAATSLIVNILIMFIMNKKYYIDIRNGVKNFETKKVDILEQKKDFEAGSGKVGPAGMAMAEFDKFSIVVENVRYNIEKELFDNLNEGDDVVFYFAPVSRFLISIEKA